MPKRFLVVISLLFVFFACTKIATTDIGNGLIPPIDGVNVKDTFFDVVTNTFIDDEFARVYKSDDHVIGTITNDPLFGKTSASTYLELKPTFYPFAFPGNKDSLQVDSVVLVLAYRGISGDSTIPQTWRVFEIPGNSKLRFDSAYPANGPAITYGDQLGVKSNFDLRSLNDSVKPYGEIAKNQIRITLSNSFATRLLQTYDSTNAYLNDSIFKERLSGFAVVPDQSSGNALVRINLLDTNTKLSFYYSTRLASATKRDTLVSYFRYNTSGGSLTSASANVIKRVRGEAQLNRFLNTRENDSLVFVQTSPGTYVTVKIPNLSSFRNALIHRAELTAYQALDDMNLDAVLEAPRYILLTAYDSANKRKINVPNDYQIEQGGVANIAAFGGFRTNRTISGVGNVNAYTFTLTRYVQGIVTRKDSSYQLRMYAPSNDSLYYKPPYPFGGMAVNPAAYIAPANANPIAIGRVRLFGGTGLPQQRMRLRIIYSEL